ncbi:MAG: SDR family NAD(P)-dependent oxidoreductase [Gammaproteobacteria bacterium]|nr:SDR family NAD(P)-dependent oxidoreductase [Gammaproteobacteria bacterium]MBU1556273.1 SDR family NAD(P)-dependent oxidoreductase [Gammaproteobacteria bacterium]MBU2071487.1 SDR family NAD(P)-dependent oxidoreductase [Gammaproteobacteria bacterium]MBU2181521.1 SDR family NAD(P)-dependent oxidoreductase [Gammaproteobacteria bacterium]MBU2203747.1 SDR family NAD(P)-dependent oxidoreductase [Gammaproteobacteria bacterium]
MSNAVLIIGGGSGIGLALAQYYAASGAGVAVISRQSAAQQQQINWLQDTLSAEADSADIIAKALTQHPDTIFICNGVLHDASAMPEKTIRQLDIDILAARFASNVQVPAMYLKLLFSYLCKQPQVKLLALSAKVGSIGDNALGGWYSYRISKAALNMLIKNLSIEVGRLNKTAAIVSIHPGTTDTELSAPFQQNLPVGQLQSPDATAKRLASVADSLTAAQSGNLLNWDGNVLPW